MTSVLGCFFVTFLVATTATTEPSKRFAPSDYRPSYWRNHLADREERPLRNRFFALRHGQSEANVAKVIASDPTIATRAYGLSAVGREQAKAAGAELVADYLEARSATAEPEGRFPPPRGILVVCSDFKRAVETAERVCDAVWEHNRSFPDDGIPLRAWPDDSGGPGYSSSASSAPTTHEALRERWFGKWDGKADVHYRDVWNDDFVNPYHTVHGVESVCSVLDRATRFVRSVDDLVAEHTDGTDGTGCLWIVCVAHGDVLQILQTAFGENPDPSEHRSLEHLETATLRPFE